MRKIILNEKRIETFENIVERLGSNKNYTFNYTIYLFDFEEYKVLFNTLLNIIYLFDDKDYYSFKNKEINEKFIEDYVVMPNEMVDKITDIKEKFNPLLFGKKIGITVILGTGCNLNCIYCYAREDHHKKYKLDETSIFKVLDFLKKRGYEEIPIHFLAGGEPLLYLDTIKKIVEYTKKKFQKYEFSIQTNATLLNGIKWAIQNNFHLVISTDGIPKIQDLQRPGINFQSSKRVRDSINWLIKNKKINEVRVRATITNHSLNLVLKNMLYLYTLGFKKVGFGYDVFNYNFDDLRKINEFLKIILFLKLPISVNDLYFADDIRTHFCHPGFIITLDNKISACTENYISSKIPPFKIGKIEETGDVTIDIVKYNYLLNRNVFNLEKCRYCFLRFSCAGFCPALIYRYTNDIYKIPEHFCKTKKEMMLEQVKWIIKSYLKISPVIRNKEIIFDKLRFKKIGIDVFLKANYSEEDIFFVDTRNVEISKETIQEIFSKVIESYSEYHYPIFLINNKQKSALKEIEKRIHPLRIIYKEL